MVGCEIVRYSHNSILSAISAMSNASGLPTDFTRYRGCFGMALEGWSEDYE